MMSTGQNIMAHETMNINIGCTVDTRENSCIWCGLDTLLRILSQACLPLFGTEYDMSKAFLPLFGTEYDMSQASLPLFGTEHDMKARPSS